MMQNILRNSNDSAASHGGYTAVCNDDIGGNQNIDSRGAYDSIR